MNRMNSYSNELNFLKHDLDVMSFYPNFRAAFDKLKDYNRNNLTLSYYIKENYNLGLRKALSMRLNAIYGLLYEPIYSNETLIPKRFQSVLLKTMIDWRLRNIWKSDRYWHYLKNEKTIIYMTDNIIYKGGE